MSLWMPWWNAIWLLRQAFPRLRTFLWFATAVAGFTVRTELLGVTSLVRALKLDARFYNKLVDHFHSPAVQLEKVGAQIGLPAKAPSKKGCGNTGLPARMACSIVA